MCKPRQSLQPAAPVTGPTTRLDDTAAIQKGQPGAAHTGWCGSARFPWWTLWLIWPLIGLAKAVAPAAASAVVLVSQWTVPVLPLLLIVAGVVLLLALRRDTRAYPSEERDGNDL